MSTHNDTVCWAPKKKVLQDNEIEDSNVFILFSHVGNRPVDSTPKAFITLDQFKEFAYNRLGDMLEDQTYSTVKYYMTIMIPNKPIEHEGDEGVYFKVKGKTELVVQFERMNLEFDIYDSTDYKQMIHFIKLMYKKKQELTSLSLKPLGPIGNCCCLHP
jgi:hypothetical protein